MRKRSSQMGSSSASRLLVPLSNEGPFRWRSAESGMLAILSSNEIRGRRACKLEPTWIGFCGKKKNRRSASEEGGGEREGAERRGGGAGCGRELLEEKGDVLKDSKTCLRKR